LDIDSKSVKLQIWDFAGSERFVSITKSRFEEANGIIIVYDITNQESFEDIERYWGQELSKHKIKPGVARILVGNKVDLGDRRIVDSAKAKTLSEEYGCKFIETSAKMSTNVNQLFETIARDVLVEWQKNQKPDHWREAQIKKKKCILQ
jgi:small GTP-binding protein